MKNLMMTLALLTGVFATAQIKQVGQDIVEYNGQKYPCHVYEYPSAANLVEDAIKEKMLSAGNKTDKGAKNWLVYKNVLLPGHTEGGLYDVYIKVEERGKKDNVKSTVYVIATKPNEISDEKVSKADRSSTAVNIGLAAGGAAFLSGLDEQVGNKQFDADMKLQELLAAKEDKKLIGLKEAQRKIESRIKDLQDELAQNMKEQELQSNVLAKEKTKFEAMKEKKTGVPASKKD
jgi:hypothetical protein